MAEKYVFDAERYKNLQSTLKSSPTAYARGVPATRADLKTQLELMGMDKSREAQLSEDTRTAWYGTKEAPRFEKSGDEAKGKDEGLLMRGLNALATPLYGTVGAVEALTGSGTEKGIGNIWANIKERGTFGDLLSQAGMPKGSTMPLGFVLDVMFDPVNWMTVGTGALIPRIVKGAAKGKAEGAVAGLASGLAKKGAFVSKKLQPKAVEYSTWYDELVGRTPHTAVEEAKKRFSVKASKKAVGMMPEGWYYDPQGNIVRAVSKERDDIARKATETSFYGDNQLDRMLHEADTMKKGANPELNKMANDAKEILFGGTGKIGSEVRGVDGRMSAAPLAARVKGVKTQVERDAEWVEDIYNPKSGSISSNSGELGKRLRQENVEEGKLRKIVKATGKEKTELIPVSDDTGWKIYDNFKKQIRSKSKKTADALDAYAVFINAFKIAKTGMNPGTWTTAVVGNTFFRGMAGLKPRVEAAKSVMNAYKLSKGSKMSKKYIDIMNSPAWQDWINTNPSSFASVFGVNRAMLATQRGFINEIGKAVDASLINKGLDGVERQKYVKEVMDEVVKFKDKISKTSAVDIQRGTYIHGVDAATGRPITGPSVHTTGLSTEIFDTPFSKLLADMERRAVGEGPGATAAKAAAWYMKKPMEFYERFDQSFKLGTMIDLVEHGIDEDEIKMLTRFLGGLDPIDYNYVKETGRYHLSHDKAMEAVSKIYMNYMAMPAAARVFRGLPLIGAPFASFTYAMLGKTAETALHNPAFINKVTYALQEMSGANSPLEKAALEEPYYERYNDPAMLKLNFLPFFQDNPIYLNVANMIPYYSMNIFQPSERRFEEPVADIVAQINDRFPLLMKTPEGQVLFDYVILPTLLRDEEPVGLFNQPLYPSDAGALGKAGYGLRSAAEAVVPPSIGFAGLLTPEAIAPYLPSYRWRQMTYAKEGKTPLGIEASEPAFQRTARTISSMFGAPIYPIKLEYISSKVKKDLK